MDGGFNMKRYRKITIVILLILFIFLNACSSSILAKDDIIIGPSGINLDHESGAKWSINFALTLSEGSRIEKIDKITGIKLDTNHMGNPFQEIKITKMTDKFGYKELLELPPLKLPINLSKNEQILIVIISNIDPKNLEIHNIQIEYGDGKTLILNEVQQIMKRLNNR
jgi:hypothetical protein